MGRSKPKKDKHPELVDPHFEVEIVDEEAQELARIRKVLETFGYKVLMVNPCPMASTARYEVLLEPSELR